MEDPGLEVRKAWLPAATQVLTRDMALQLELEGLTGVRVTQVYPHSSAEKAGLKIGDLIIKLDGEKIPVSEPEDFEVLPTMIREYKIGTKSTFTVMRGKKELDLTIELPESPKLPRELKKYRDDNSELTVREIALLVFLEIELGDVEIDLSLLDVAGILALLELELFDRRIVVRLDLVAAHLL